MASLAEYFRANRYVSRWQIGDRVFGKWNSIPFVGTVGNDSVISELEGPIASIRLDLPFKYQGQIYHHLRVKPTSIKKLKNHEDT